MPLHSSLAENQRPISRYKPLHPEDAWAKLIHAAEELKLQGTLSNAQITSVSDAIGILKTRQTSDRHKKYKRFLYDTLRASGPQMVLLSAVALGQTKATDMKKSDRQLLVQQFETSKDRIDINHPTLQSLVDSYGIPKSADDVLSPVETNQSLRLDTLQNIPGIGRRNDRILISTMMNPAPPDEQPIRGSRYEVTSEAHRLTSQPISVLPEDGQYWPFSFMSRRMIYNLPEPFLTGMKASNLWKQEQERGGLAITNCLSLYLPKTLNEDALCLVRIGYDDGFKICNMFGFGELDIPVSGRQRTPSFS